MSMLLLTSTHSNLKTRTWVWDNFGQLKVLWKPWEIQNIKFKIYIFSNIWISKVNQTMIFGQLIEYNMINNFFQKSCAKFCGETILRTIFKNIKRKHISGSKVWSFIQFFSIVFQNWGLLKHIETNCLNFFN